MDDDRWNDRVLRFIGTLLISVLAVGCSRGIREGDTMLARSGALLCYSKIDAENGGPSDRITQLIASGRATPLGHSPARETTVRILEIQGKIAKVYVESGHDRDATGWVEVDTLKPKLKDD
jgi:hypothetical protein